MTQFDAIVLGAGAMGSAAAYYLARAGQRVLLLEQFELNHQKGSSYGYSRVIRYTYEDQIYINLVRSAYQLWFALEEEVGEKLYVKTGGLDISFPEQPTFQARLKTADSAGLDMPYGIADDGGIGVKVSTCYGRETVLLPSQVDYTPSQEWIESIRQFIRRYIPGVDGQLMSTRRCLYTMTPDKHFIIDSHPDYPHVVIGAGFSGRGFNFSILIGKILADIALFGKTELDTSLFKLSRFN